MLIIRFLLKFARIIARMTVGLVLIVATSSLLGFGIEWLFKQPFAINPKTKANFGCECVQPSIKQAFLKSVVVFSGEVLSVREERLWFGAEYSDTKTTRMRVLRNWKGELGETTEIHGSRLGCGIFFEKGEKYLVFAFSYGPHGYYTDYCGGTRPLSESLFDLEKLKIHK